MSWKITDEHIDALTRETVRTQHQVNMDGVHTCVTDVTYEHWMNDVLALPKKQQKKWKSSLTSKKGAKSKVIFKDGFFREGKSGALVSCITFAMAGRRTALTRIGALSMHLNEAVQSGLHPSVAAGTMREVLGGRRESNHTGNHYRNHTTHITGINGRTSYR